MNSGPFQLFRISVPEVSDRGGGSSNFRFVDGYRLTKEAADRFVAGLRPDKYREVDTVWAITGADGEVYLLQNPKPVKTV